MKYLHRCLLLLLLVMLSCNSTSFRAGDEQKDIPTMELDSLEVSYQSYHLKMIELIGVFNFSFENVAIYSTKEDIADVPVWIDFSDSLNNTLSQESLEFLQGRKLRVQGIYDSTDGGHLGQYSGTIKVIFLETMD